ncbi:MAG: hypothetical protein WBA46_13595 [Thermomicrobiales bacterium]
MSEGQGIALTAFIVLLLVTIAAGIRMWRLRQTGLATACGAIAGFIFMLGFWYLTTIP